MEMEAVHQAVGICVGVCLEPRFVIIALQTRLSARVFESFETGVHCSTQVSKRQQRQNATTRAASTKSGRSTGTTAEMKMNLTKQHRQQKKKKKTKE